MFLCEKYVRKKESRLLATQTMAGTFIIAFFFKNPLFLDLRSFIILLLIYILCKNAY